jgi:4-hydroxymandelate synthase
VVTTGRGVWRFLDKHGDGIADIALTCDDMKAAQEAAVGVGARPIPSRYRVPCVSAFGDVCHTLLPRRPANTAPPGRRWVAASEPPAPSAARIRLLDHVAICLERGTMEDQAAFYGNAFGFSASAQAAVGGQAVGSTVVRSESGHVTFALAAAPDTATEPGPLDDFLRRNGGAGVRSLAFLTDDIVPTVRGFRERGVEFRRTPDAHDDQSADRFTGLADLRDAHVLADGDAGAYLLQAFARSPHERNTLSYDLIQRQGFPGLVSTGLMARYVAVERDQLAVR